MLKVRGYASVFGNVDSTGEVVDRGAFSDWIAKHAEEAVGLYWGHGPRFNPLAKPVGHTTSIRQDKKGLYYEGMILDTPEGLEVQEIVGKRGAMPASFAYGIVDQYQKGEIWHLSRLDLLEISAVNWGANEKAYIEAVVDASEENGNAGEE